MKAQANSDAVTITLSWEEAWQVKYFTWTAEDLEDTEISIEIFNALDELGVDEVSAQ